MWKEEHNIVSFVEIDPFCQKVLKKHWPETPIISDIRDVTWEKIFVQNAERQKKLQIKERVGSCHTANHAKQNDNRDGEKKIERSGEQQIEHGVEKRKKKSSNIMVENALVVENQPLNFLQLITNTTMEMPKGGNINLIHGKSQSKEDFQATIKSFATTAIMQNQTMEFAHIKERIKIDILTAGVPCQPASCAGKRRGSEDDRWLWPEAIRVVREFKPKWIIFENVTGFITLNNGLEFDKVLSQLETEGYETESFIIPACAKDAPHRRDRVWIIANSIKPGLERHTGNVKRGDKPGWIETEKDGSAYKGGLRQDVADTDRINDDESGYGTGKIPQLKTSRIQRLQNWLPEPSICRVAHGIRNRVDRLKSLGNAIVPQVVVPIMQAIKEHERR